MLAVTGAPTAQDRKAFDDALKVNEDNFAWTTSRLEKLPPEVALTELSYVMVMTDKIGVKLYEALAPHLSEMAKKAPQEAAAWNGIVGRQLNLLVNLDTAAIRLIKAMSPEAIDKVSGVVEFVRKASPTPAVIEPYLEFLSSMPATRLYQFPEGALMPVTPIEKQPAWEETKARFDLFRMISERLPRRVPPQVERDIFDYTKNPFKTYEEILKTPPLRSIPERFVVPPKERPVMQIPKPRPPERPYRRLTGLAGAQTAEARYRAFLRGVSDFYRATYQTLDREKALNLAFSANDTYRDFAQGNIKEDEFNRTMDLLEGELRATTPSWPWAAIVVGALAVALVVYLVLKRERS